MLSNKASSVLPPSSSSEDADAEDMRLVQLISAEKGEISLHIFHFFCNGLEKKERERLDINTCLPGNFLSR